ncbi:Protein kinase domain-containing protein [Aphelenchoides fujianensis]|nr:Protein kinase domain-containing protein [Aphelenchoides fujianensis]
MADVARQKPGSLKDPELARIFSVSDPDNRYCDLREVGSGSFGNVYFAHDRETKETVAVKKMHFGGKDALEKWQEIVKEVRFLRFVHHPHIVEYRNCYLKDQTCWLVMEYCIGSASDIIHVFKEQLVEDAIGEICFQTLLALQYIHEKNYIHRDVKAGNILITDAGIVKLADRKPPLYDFNTMSALYHIVQNPAPALSRTHPHFPHVQRSQPFRNFVGQCLDKEATFRPSAEQCLQHEFMQQRRNPDVLQSLVRLTKKRVHKLDNDAYTKMKKIFYFEGTPAPGTYGDDSSDDESECFVIPREEKPPNGDAKAATGSNGTHVHTNGNGTAESSKEPSTALLTNTQGSTSSSEDVLRRSILLNGESPALEPKRQHPDHVLRSDAVAHSRENSGDSDEKKNRTVISISETEEESKGASTPITAESSIRSGEVLRQKDFNEEINTLKRSKFATMRSTKIITREMEEARRENNAKEQMSGYQRLRQHHHRELLQLEERCKFEAEAMRQKQEKEYEQYLLASQREINKVRATNQTHLEKKARENEETLRKVRKHRTAANEHELKSFVVCQKREYKFNKEQAKRQLKERGLRKNAYEEAVKNAKSDLMKKWRAAETEFVAQQKDHMAAELAEVQRKCQSELQCMEQRLLANEHAVRVRQLDAIEYMLMNHHNAARDQALAHFSECAQMKKRHLQVQHDSELNNQTDYTKRQEDEMKRQHALRQKHLPRELKMKEAQIKKQFRHTVKTQARQYKALQTQLQQGVPKDEQREISNRLKEEQTRKIASLAALYDDNIKKMMSEQTIKLDSGQEEEMRELREKLGREMEVLLDFQKRQKNSLDEACQREYENLNASWAKKKAALQQKINEDRLRFESERSGQLHKLEMGQHQERTKMQALNLGDRDRASSKGSGQRSDDLANDSVPSTPNLQSTHSTSQRNSRSASTSNRSSPSHQSTNL